MVLALKRSLIKILYECVLDFSIFDLKSDFPSAMNVVVCLLSGLKHSSTQLIEVDIPRFSAEFL